MFLPLVQHQKLSPNQNALPYVRELIDRHVALRVDVFRQCGATVIDCGVTAQGGLEAGVLFSKICLGGLADVKLTWQDFEGLRWMAAEVTTDHPIRACMASQYAGWPIKCGERVWMGSGPACAVVSKGSLFRTLGYKDPSDIVILCLECSKLPSDDVLLTVLEECQCAPENLFVLVAPTTSLVGTVQVAARALETGIFKLRRLGYDLGNLVSGFGVCPVSPVAGDTISGLGRTNDAISYGASVLLQVRDTDEAIHTAVKKTPSCVSPGYGLAYMDGEQGHDNFFNRGPEQFNPAVLSMNNLNSGRTFTSGLLRPDILRRAFGLR